MSAIQRAGNSGLLTHAECTRVFNTDLIMKAFTADGKEIWVAFEISAIIEDNDIERALESADILRRLMGIQAVAAVGGYAISNPQAEQAKDSGVEVFIFKALSAYRSKRGVRLIDRRGLRVYTMRRRI